MDLSKEDVLIAAKKAISCKSAYIGDEVNRIHAARVRAGGSGHAPQSGLVLRRLRQLCRDGMMECTGGPDGFYGFSWSITPAGHAKLSEIGS